MRKVRSRAWALVSLAFLAVQVNLHAPTVFFDMQLMFGSGVAVLALLLFGWGGLFVGAAALAVTVVRWGHPFELLIGMGLRYFSLHPAQLLEIKQQVLMSNASQLSTRVAAFIEML